jgi:hypothetical protein
MAADGAAPLCKPPARVRIVLGVMASLPLVMLLIAVMYYNGMVGAAEMSLGTTMCLATMSAMNSWLLVARNGRTTEVVKIR